MGDKKLSRHKNKLKGYNEDDVLNLQELKSKNSNKYQLLTLTKDNNSNNNK